MRLPFSVPRMMRMRSASGHTGSSSAGSSSFSGTTRRAQSPKVRRSCPFVSR